MLALTAAVDVDEVERNYHSVAYLVDIDYGVSIIDYFLIEIFRCVAEICFEQYGAAVLPLRHDWHSF